MKRKMQLVAGIVGIVAGTIMTFMCLLTLTMRELLSATANKLAIELGFSGEITMSLMITVFIFLILLGVASVTVSIFILASKSEKLRHGMNIALVVLSAVSLLLFCEEYMLLLLFGTELAFAIVALAVKDTAAPVNSRFRSKYRFEYGPFSGSSALIPFWYKDKEYFITAQQFSKIRDLMRMHELGAIDDAARDRGIEKVLGIDIDPFE